MFSIGQRFRAGRYKISHLQQYLPVMCHFMKGLFPIWFLLFASTNALGQTLDSSRLEFGKRLESGNPLVIQYDHGGCFISHSQQIIVEASNSDSLSVTIKRLLPVAYRLYKYNERKRKYEAQDSIQISNPFTFKYPKMGDKDYSFSKREYLTELTFKVHRAKFSNFLNEFIHLADNGKLPLSGTEIEGLYSNIHLIRNDVAKDFSFRGWYQFDIEIQLLQ
jgi:hypothetical protein